MRLKLLCALAVMSLATASGQQQKKKASPGRPGAAPTPAASSRLPYKLGTQSYSFTTIAKVGDMIGETPIRYIRDCHDPGGEISPCAVVAPISVNRRGDVAFTAGFEAPLNHRSEAVVVSRATPTGRELHVIARTGGEFEPGVTYWDFGRPVLNDNGDVAYLATYQRGKCVLCWREGIFLNGKLLIESKSTVDGVLLSRFHDPELNNRGTVAFFAGEVVVTQRGIVAKRTTSISGLELRILHEVSLSLNDADEVVFYATASPPGEYKPLGAVFSSKALLASNPQGGTHTQRINNKGSVAYYVNERGDGRIVTIPPTKDIPSRNPAFAFNDEGEIVVGGRLSGGLHSNLRGLVEERAGVDVPVHLLESSPVSADYSPAGLSQAGHVAYRRLVIYGNVTNSRAEVVLATPLPKSKQN